jgi:hypothetical protein
MGLETNNCVETDSDSLIQKKEKQNNETVPPNTHTHTHTHTHTQRHHEELSSTKWIQCPLCSGGPSETSQHLFGDSVCARAHG